MSSILNDDTALWESIRKGDYAAFESLYRRMWEPLYVFALRRLKSKDDAEDVVQQVFMRLWERRETRSIQTSFSNYLFTAVRYEVIDRLSAMMNDPEKIGLVQENILPAFNDIVDRLSVRDLDKEIAGFIDEMPPQRQEIFRLSREEELSAREIAERMNLSEKTVRNQISLAVGQLRHLVKASLVLLAAGLFR